MRVLSVVLPPQVRLPEKVIFMSEAERLDPRSIRPGRLVVVSNSDRKPAQRPADEKKSENGSAGSGDAGLALFTVDWLQFAVVRRLRADSNLLPLQVARLLAYDARCDRLVDARFDIALTRE